MQGVLLYCGCGYRVWSKLERVGRSLGTLVFFDDEQTSETYTERVIRCPGCSERLVEDIFAPHTIKRQSTE
jgi:hypothetical protein